MAIETACTESTIILESITVKAELTKLQDELEGFLRTPQCEQKQPTPPYSDPISETIATLQDCKGIIHHVRNLVIERITNRIQKT